MKRCPRCGQDKRLIDFAKNKKKLDGLQVHCRQCKKEQDADHYQRNKAAQIARVKVLAQQRRQKLNEMKGQSGCKLCEENDPCCLEYHHLDPKQKDLEVSVALVRWSWSRILSEIDKCVLLCSNCHKKVHAGRREAGLVAQSAEQDSLKVKVQGSTPCGTT